VSPLFLVGGGRSIGHSLTPLRTSSEGEGASCFQIVLFRTFSTCFQLFPTLRLRRFLSGFPCIASVTGLRFGRRPPHVPRFIVAVGLDSI
jgi:hypothetical protein